MPNRLLMKYRGPSIGIPLTKGRAVAVGVKDSGTIKLLILEGEFELPADLGRTLKKRIREMDDKRRYVIVTQLSSRSKHWLFYNLESDTYTMGDLQSASAFKRRGVAEAVMGLLRSEWHEVFECRKQRDGTLTFANE